MTDPARLADGITKEPGSVSGVRFEVGPPRPAMQYGLSDEARREACEIAAWSLKCAHVLFKAAHEEMEKGAKSNTAWVTAYREGILRDLDIAERAARLAGVRL